MINLTTLTGVTVYHAQLPQMVIATIRGVGINGEGVNISIDSDRFNIELISYPEIFSKTYKTITGAIKGAFKFINNVVESEIEVYINPDLIHLLPAKWANANALQVIKFEVGASYATDEGDVYTVTKRGMSEYFSCSPFIGLIDSRLINRQHSDHYHSISYDNGVEICERKLLYRTILRADQPVEITTQGEITADDVIFSDGEWDTTPTPQENDFWTLVIFAKYIDSITHTVEFLVKNQELSEKTSWCGQRKFKCVAQAKPNTLKVFKLLVMCCTKQYLLWCDTS